MRACLLALLLVAVSSAVCSDEGGGDTSPAEGYFQSLQRLDAEFERRFEQLPDEFLSIFGNATLEERLEALDRGRAIVQDMEDDYLAGLDELDPPADARTLHAAYREANVESFEHFDEILADARDSTSLEEYVEALFADAGKPLDTHVVDICNDLQDLAAGKGIDIALECGKRTE